MSDLDPERRRSWFAVLLLLDLDAGVAQLGTGPVDRELLWELRSHLGGRRRDGGNLLADLTITQLVWIVQTFRGLWPATPHPSGSTTGDANPWDATDFLNGLIARIADGRRPGKTEGRPT